MEYSKVQINNNIRNLLEEGYSNDDALDFFLRMSMTNDLSCERPFITKGPSPSDVYDNLIGNDVISKDDFKLEMTKGTKVPTQRLVVRLSPTCTLYAEMVHVSLQVTINEKMMTFMYLKSYRADDIAFWMIRQKENLAKYMENWDTVLAIAKKKAKSNHMAFLGIRDLLAAIWAEHRFVGHGIMANVAFHPRTPPPQIFASMHRIVDNNGK